MSRTTLGKVFLNFFDIFFFLFSLLVVHHLVEVDVLLGVPVVEVLLHDAGLPVDDGKHKWSQP